MISREDVVDRRKDRQNSNQTAEHTRHDTMKSQVKEQQQGWEDTKRTRHTLVAEQMPGHFPCGSLWQTI